MQRILIGENVKLDYANQSFLELLTEVYGNDEDYWRSYEIQHESYKDLRTDIKLHKIIENRKFILDTFYSSVWDSQFTMKCKIVEIPDCAEWEIKENEYSNGEYIVEKHRTWY